MHTKKIIREGKEPLAGQPVLVLLHGRGASAEDILSLSSHLHVNDFSLLAPQATNHSWYPYSFLAPPSQNEPWLSSALDLLKELLEELQQKGIASQHIYFTGFSQGACLLLEFACRHAARYGGIAAFTGGLIGDRVYRDHYRGDFQGTPVFIGTGDPDPHVPVERVYATSNILRELNASVTEKVYANMAHTIIPDEIENANRIVFREGNRGDRSGGGAQGELE